VGSGAPFLPPQATRSLNRHFDCGGSVRHGASAPKNEGGFQNNHPAITLAVIPGGARIAPSRPRARHAEVAGRVETCLLCTNLRTAGPRTIEGAGHLRMTIRAERDPGA